MTLRESVYYLLCILVVAGGVENSSLYPVSSDYGTEAKSSNSFNTTIKFNNTGSTLPGDQPFETCQQKASHDFIYLLYKKLENSLIHSPKTLLQLRRVFFPITGTHTQEVRIVQLKVKVCVAAVSRQELQQTCSREINFALMWTNSPLFSMVTVDQFVTMESVFIPNLYGRIATAMKEYRTPIPLHIYDLQCIPQQEDLVKAIVPLLSWAKAYARSADGKPETFEERDKGYIAKWYSYYTSESLYKEHDHVRDMRIALLATFVSLNILIPIGFAFGGATKLQSVVVPNTLQGNNAPWQKAVAITVIVANLMYFLCFVTQASLHTGKNGSVWECITSKQHCHMPTNTILYWDETATMISKFSVIPLAFLIELIIAVQIQINSSTKHSKLRSYTRSRSKKLKVKLIASRCYKIFVLWNAMITVQICVGMALLPVAILFIIAPATTLSFLGCAGLIPVYLALAIRYIFLEIKCHKNYKVCVLVFVKLLSFAVLLVLVVSLGVIYISLLEIGVSIKSLKGLTLSLLPSFVLSILAWCIRKKFLKNKRGNRSRQMSHWHEFVLSSTPGEEHEHLLGALQNDTEESDHV